MKKSALAFLFASFAFLSTNAQDYNTGIGLRGGFSQGITGKHFVSETSAFEGIFASRWKGFELTALYETHGRAFEVDRLNWYAGFGGHIGSWDGRDARWGEDGNAYTVVGIDGIVGLEYNFKPVPFNLSVDWKPSYNIFGYTGFWGDGAALSVRYIF